MDSVTPDKISRLKTLLEGCGNVVVVSHTHPDGDALGCLSAAWHYLSAKQGRNVSALVEEGRPGDLEFILDGVSCGSDVKVLETCDLVVVLDLNTLDRTGRFEQAVRACKAPRVLVDHHLNPAEDDFDLVFSSIGVSSACELLFRVLKALEGGMAGIPQASLNALMCGITTDTNNFANSVWPGTLAAVSELLAAGVDRDEIIRRIYQSCRENRVRAMSWLLDNKLRIDGAFAFIVITAAERSRFELREGELDGLVNIPLSIASVRLSATFTEDDGFFRVSLRSKKGTSANAFARSCFHGGGHEQASGGRLYFPEDVKDRGEVEDYVMAAAARFLQNG